MEEQKEKLDFLKREEIRTMAKDLAVLREAEAKKERERIAALKAEKEALKKAKEQAMERPEEGRKEERREEEEIEKEIKEIKELLPTDLMPKAPPARPFFLGKYLVRFIIVLFIVLISVGAYWRFVKKGPPQPTCLEGTPYNQCSQNKPRYCENGDLINKCSICSCPEDQECGADENCTVKISTTTPVVSEIIIPTSLILTDATMTPEISRNEEIPSTFQSLKQNLATGTIARVIFKNKGENRLTTLEELISSFQADTLKELSQKLESNFTLAIYGQSQGQRTIFVAKIKEGEEKPLADLLKNWEMKVAKEGLMLSGKKIETIAVYFSNAFYKEKKFRYITIAKTDLGICYALIDDYFIITTSYESMQKTIDQVKKTPLERKVGQLFIIGFEGKTVTSKLTELFKKYQPGGVLLLAKNIESKEQLKKLTTDLQNLSLKETGLPLLITVDQEGDPLNRIGFLEEKTAQSAIENTNMAYEVGLKRGLELKELGVNTNLAPMLDQMQNTDFYFNRSFQKTATETGELAKSLVLGQNKAGILSSIKHFPGYVGIRFNPEIQLATLDKAPETSQFKKASEADPEFVMAGNVIYKDIDPLLPFAFSKKGIQSIKDSLGNDILIISDDLAQNSLLKRFSLKDAITKPLEAGIDIVIFSGYSSPVEQGLSTFFMAVQKGEISPTKISKAVSKVVELKQKLKTE